MNLRERLLCYAREVGIDLVGVTDAEPFTTARSVLEDRRRRGFYAPFAPSDIEGAWNPSFTLPEAKSIIAVGLSYYQGDVPLPGGYRGDIARAAWGQDYHRVVGARLELLQAFLRREAPGSQNTVFVDTGPLLDKEVAKRAGLGWFGKNTLLVTRFGSWVSLGGILTTVPLTPDSAVGDDCGECDLCLRACPTGALLAPGVLDPGRCLSCLTQKKGYFPLELRQVLGQRIYGCDTCQEVCPCNRGVPVTTHHEFLPREQGHRPELIKLMGMTNGEFKAAFRNSAAGWRGRTVLQRNALVALGNIGDPVFIPLLADCLRDPRPLIRGHAAWALGCIEDRRAKGILEKAAAGETDPRVQLEIRLALGTAR